MKNNLKLIRKALPEHIYILGHKFTIIVKSIDSTTTPGDTSEPDHTYGEMHGYRRQIFINPYQTVELARRTLIHEAIHAALHVSGLTETLDGYNDSLEETLVMALESALSHAVDIDALTDHPSCPITEGK